MKAVARRRLKTKHDAMVTGSQSKVQVSPGTPAESTIKVNLKATENNKRALKITENQGKNISSIEEDPLDSFKLSDHLDLFEVHAAESLGQARLANDRKVHPVAGGEARGDINDDLDAAFVDELLDDELLDDVLLDRASLKDVLLGDELLDDELLGDELLGDELLDDVSLDEKTEAV